MVASGYEDCGELPMKKTLKAALKNHEFTFGTWITLGNPAIAEIMAQAGFDWLVIDMEHSALAFRQAEELIRVIELAGGTPLVRVWSNERVVIKKVLDSGAHGIIVPMVNCVEETLRCISSAYYPPRGTRSVGLARAQGYGQTFEEYCEWSARETVVIVQVEHVDSVRNLEKILCVDGVDGCMIGLYDLSASIGRPGDFDDPQVVRLLAEIRRVALHCGRSVGLHSVAPDTDQFRKRVDEGFNFLAYSVDSVMFSTLCRRAVSDIRSIVQP